MLREALPVKAGLSALRRREEEGREGAEVGWGGGEIEGRRVGSKEIIVTFAKFFKDMSLLGKFDTYKIDLKSLSIGVHEMEYLLENKFFANIDMPELQKGKVNVHLTVKHSKAMTEMNFVIEGVVYVPCDRCLDDVEIPIETKNRLIVKIGKEYSEESDEIVVIPADEGAINVAWYLYEFVALAIPIKRVHAPGKCNKTMSSKLKKHAAKNISGEEEDGIEEAPEEEGAEIVDPRWEALKGLMENETENE
jgi:uncharacterized metal-binding protein YceD (DUF177 family)